MFFLTVLTFGYRGLTRNGVIAFLFNWADRKKNAMRIHLNWWRLSLRRTWRRRLNRQLLQNTRDILCVRIDAPVGLFAHLSWCLEIVAYCEKLKLRPCITCTSRQYGEGGRDWFNVFFQQPAARQVLASREKQPLLRVSEFEEMPFYMNFNPEFTIGEMARLQRAHFPVAESTARKVDAYVDAHFQPHKTQSGRIIGCHYRGTDKSVEARRIAYDEMTAALKHALAQFPGGAALFVATDEAAFLAHVRAEFPQTPVLSADHKRSSDGRALHFTQEAHGLANCEQALIDSLLLSRCDALVKSPSALSAWAKVFNPALPVTLVGRPYPHAMFCPESVVVREHDKAAAANPGAGPAGVRLIKT